jgi:hypothetical protein
MGSVRALSDYDVVGQLERSLEDTLRADTQLLYSVARTLVDSHFPATVARTSWPRSAWSPTWSCRQAATSYLIRRQRPVSVPRGGGWRYCSPGTTSAPSAATTASSPAPQSVSKPRTYGGSPSAARTASTTGSRCACYTTSCSTSA